MEEKALHFQPGERFPKEMAIPQYPDLVRTLKDYGIDGVCTATLIDSTHDAEDIRLNYIIDRKWVLRYCKAPEITEEYLRDLSRLVERYRRLNIRCPRFIPDENGVYLHTWNQLNCYLSEYVDLPLADSRKLQNPDRLIREVAESVALFAQTYKNVDLSRTMGMYSLFDLCPFDLPNGIDEKEDNFRHLLETLRNMGENRLAKKLDARHGEVRQKLKAVYQTLPRCVFQGDENFSNVLIDQDEHFAGLIDFNLAGTEVVVNQLANLAGFDYDEKNKVPEGAAKRLDAAIRYFREHAAPMLKVYHATETEKKAMGWYAWIVMIAQWPTLCYFRDSLTGEMQSETLELLSLIAEVPEERLMEGL